MARYTTVVLDVDGTLVDSNAAHAGAWTEALEEQGRQIPFERIRLLIGMGADNLLPTLLGISHESDEGKAIATRAGRIFEERYLHALKPFPRVRAFVERLQREGFRVVVASSAEEALLDRLLKVADVDDLIEQRVSATDVRRSKPEPDCVLSALKKANASPAHAVMVGDTPYDVAAALRASVDIIGLRSGGWDDDHLAGAVAIYDNAASLLADIAESPLSRSPRSDRRTRWGSHGPAASERRA